MKLELRSVRLKNIGPIDDIKIDFFDAKGKTLPVCVIGGANGSGKTTLLEVIVGLAEILRSGGYGEFFRPKPNSYLQADWMIDGIEISTFYGTLPGDEVLMKEHCGVKVTAQHRNATHLERINTPLYEEIQQRIRNQEGNPLPWRLSQTYWTANNLAPSLIYLPHTRSLEPVSGQQIQKESASYSFVNRIQTVRQFPGSLTSYLIWLDYAEPEQFSDVRQFLNELDFEGKTFEVDRKALEVNVKTPNGNEHKLHELSSGEQNLLIVFIELRRKLLPGSVVLIDEIENSLHPAFQHRLAQGLLALQREVPYQLIVTTHAPAFVEIFGEKNTRILTPF
jgi:predicted ATPase